jgi:hypothetical protein
MLLFGGMEMRPTNIILRSSGPANGGSMSLSVEEMVAAGAVAGRDLTQPKRHLIFAPTPFPMTRLHAVSAPLTKVKLAA